MPMISGTKRESNKARDVSTCMTCTLANGVPCSPCSVFTDLETKIAQTEILLKNLIAQQDGLRTRINSSHEPMIHRLPLELSTHIFELSLPPCWSTSMETAPSKTELYTALYISAVCRTWRRIAMETPHLWKAIPIFIGNKYERHGTTLKYVEEWLQRAGDHPLSLRVHVDCELDYMPRSKSEKGWRWFWSREVDTALLSLVALINEHSHRWQNLELVLPMKLVEMFDGTSDGAPILEKLRIRPPMAQGYTDFPLGSFSLKGSIRPAPTVVDISKLEHVNILWYNATTINWDDFYVKTTLEVLRNSRRLVNCLLGYPIVVRQHNVPVDGDSPVTCSSLRSLRIGGTDRQIMAKFWNLLTLPQLRNLETSCSTLPYHNIMHMLTRSSCCLTSLFLGYFCAQPGDTRQLFELLRHTTHLKVLSLKICISGPWAAMMYHDLNTLCDLLNGVASTTSDTLQSSDKQFILPNLVSLSLVNLPIDDGPEVQWSSVADLFNDLGPHNPSAPCRRRPLNTLRLSFAASRQDLSNPFSPFYIDGESVQRFSEVVKSGKISLDIRIPHSSRPNESVDLIASSIHHFGINPPEDVVTTRKAQET